MDTNQLDILQQDTHIKEAIPYYLKMHDAIVNAVTQDLKSKFLKEITQLELDHDRHCQDLQVKFQEQLTKELLQQQLKHEKASKAQGSAFGNLPLVQSLSRTISEREKEIDVMKLQMKSLKKQVSDLTKSISPSKIVHLTPHLSINPPTPLTHPVIDTPTPISPKLNKIPSNEESQPPESNEESQPPESNEESQPPESNEDSQPPESNEDSQPPESNEETQPPESNEETQPPESNEETQVTESIYEPPPVSSLGKIKYKGKLYYIDKLPNENGEYCVYECLNNQPGRIVGQKGPDGKYVMH
jgi:uncharacterized coiled-coil protein SlyX